MKIEFDSAKSEKNASKRGLPFERAAEFDWDGAIFTQDARNPYPERRFVALGYLGERLHVVCFTPIEGGVWIISFRKANARLDLCILSFPRKRESSNRLKKLDTRFRGYDKEGLFA